MNRILVTVLQTHLIVKAGSMGYIDGYAFNGGTCYAVVVLPLDGENKLVPIPIHKLRIESDEIS